jgi:hypothetical protein
MRCIRSTGGEVRIQYSTVHPPIMSLGSLEIVAIAFAAARGA